MTDYDPKSDDVITTTPQLQGGCGLLIKETMSILNIVTLSMPSHRSTQCRQALEGCESGYLGDEDSMVRSRGGARNQCGNTQSE